LLLLPEKLLLIAGEAEEKLMNFGGCEEGFLSVVFVCRVFEWKSEVIADE
jgi:hypothetical protein